MDTLAKSKRTKIPNEPELAKLTAELATTAEHFDRSAAFPRANFDILAREGLTGLTVPRDFGGSGAGFGDSIRVLGAVAKGEPSTALILFMTYAFHAVPQRRGNWPPEVYERLARDAVTGGGLIGMLRVEPELGTPARGGLPATTAHRTSDGWRLSGEKIYATGSTGLAWMLVYARTDAPHPRTGMLLVDPASPGITIIPEWDHLGMRASVSHRVVFDETPVSALNADFGGFREPETQSDNANHGALWNALAIAAIYDGIARAARDWLADYLNDRTPANLGAALATLPRVQEKFGEIEGLLLVNRALLANAAQAADRGDPPPPVEFNMIKHVVTTNAIDAVAKGLELTGNPGISRRNPLERHYRDVLCSRIHSPQSDTILVSAGKSGLARA